MIYLFDFFNESIFFQFNSIYYYFLYKDDRIKVLRNEEENNLTTRKPVDTRITTA